MMGKCAWWSWLALAALAALVVVAGCGGSSGKAAGTEGGPCYGNQSCNAGLTCASNLCVRLSGSGGAGGGSQGSSGQGGSPATGQGGSSGATGTGGLVGTGGQAGTGAQGGAGGQAPTTYALHFGPLQVAAGFEDTQCVVVRLGNSAAIHVGQIHNQADASALQMIVYTSTETTERTTPFDCTPFSGVIQQSGMTPLTISENPDETLTFPSGVGIPLGANQMMRIELHYSNASATAVSVQATSTLTTMPDAAFQSAAGFLAVEDQDISIAPQGTFTLGPVFVPFPSTVTGGKFFAVTSEQHQWGTSAQLLSASSSGDPGTSIYTNTSWNAPPLTPLQPALTAAAGAGFNLLCNYHSLASGTVVDGQAASNEICLFVGYYYPSQGPQICLHTNQGGGSGINVCCPGGSSCGSL
jgi:hypothetical protein